MKPKGFTGEDLRVADLALKGRRESYYDKFRNRVIFPMIDLRGSVIGFGGRVMDDSKPKYLNTADTLVFKKSMNLFAMNFAKNARADCLILAEGYMDVISMHQAGFTHAAAKLGTAPVSYTHLDVYKRQVQHLHFPMLGGRLLGWPPG